MLAVLGFNGSSDLPWTGLRRRTTGQDQDFVDSVRRGVHHLADGS
jgi:hypothetical protein